jgi:hypothetical protein
MRNSTIVVAGVMLALLLTLPVAPAQPLKIVEVGKPAVNCVFQTDCRIPVTDSIGHIPLPFLAAPNSAWLQSRTYAGEAGAPGAGKTGYEYRLSMTEASGASDCVAGLTLNFGPVTQLPYKDGQLADVFVVTTGGLGTIGLKSAEKFGDVIVFEFKKPVCSEGPPDIAKTTFFFGLAAATAPMKIKAQVFVIGDPPFFSIDARVPTHDVPPPAPDEGN